MHQPTRADGRLSALYAAAASGLDIAAFVVQAVWLICMVGLAALAMAIVAGAYSAIFS